MKKIVLVTFLLLASVFMFAEKYTIVSFNINGNNDNREFQKALNYVVEHNNADIVLLQEVNLSNNEDIIMESLTKYLPSTWKWYTTAKDMENAREHNNKQHNAILYDTLKFDVSPVDKNKMCDSRFNNVQALEFKTKDGKEFIVVNVHISPRGEYSISFNQKNKSKHTKEFDNVIKFIEDIGKEAPLILGGDMNFILQDLLDYFDKNTFSGDWIIDGSKDEFINPKKRTKKNPEGIEPWLTTIGKYGHDFDHFIYNINYEYEKFDFKIEKVQVDEYNKPYSMRHALDSNEYKGGVKVKDGVDYLRFKDYKHDISDHLPICITIETK